MELVALGTVVIMFLSWSVVGVRLMLLKDGGFLEFALGGSLFAVAGLGYPLTVLMQAIPGLPSGGRLALQIAAVSLINGGLFGIFLFTWRVFRRDATWAKALVAVGGLALLAQGMASVWDGASTRDIAGSFARWHALSIALCGVAFGWTGIESLHYRSLLKRRASLGLADPVVLNRMTLWAALGCLIALVSAVDCTLIWTAGDNPFVIDVVLIVVNAVSGTADSVLVLLAFMPPQWYLRRIRGSASAGTVAGES
ncbi:MAG: hypothetical protein MJE66_10380 [Proteobacteria bacterium]|nr:hypothetical protein [Pseudomonadota bacterium]